MSLRSLSFVLLGGAALAAGGVASVLTSPLPHVDDHALAVRVAGPETDGDTVTYTIHRRPRWSWLPISPATETVDRATFIRRAELGTHARGPAPRAPHGRDELLLLLDPPRENPDPAWIRHLIERFDPGGAPEPVLARP